MKTDFRLRSTTRQAFKQRLRQGGFIGLLSLGLLPSGMWSRALAESPFPVAHFLGLTLEASQSTASQSEPLAPSPGQARPGSPQSDPVAGNIAEPDHAVESAMLPSAMQSDLSTDASRGPVGGNAHAARSSFDATDADDAAPMVAFPPLVAPDSRPVEPVESEHRGEQRPGETTTRDAAPTSDDLELFEGPEHHQQRDDMYFAPAFDSSFEQSLRSPDDRTTDAAHPHASDRTPHASTRTDATVSHQSAFAGQTGERSGRDRPTRDRDVDSSVAPLPRLPEGVVQQAREYINAGIQQAERGAIYSARSQFIKVLRLTTQSFDAQTHSNRYSTALAAGLRALEESNDFRPAGSQLEGDMNVVNVIQSHQTPVLKNVDSSTLTPLAAASAYHAYAEKQLAVAAGEELVAADAYYGLAKLQSHLDVGRPDRDRHNGPVAMSFYQAALIAFPEHYLAANELGVLFARFGQLQDARDVLRFALTLNPRSPELWLNLSRVHERLGEADLAKRAQGEYEHAMQLANRSASDLASRNHPSVQWLDPADFARVGGDRESLLASDPRGASTAPREGTSSSETPPVETANKKAGWGFWPFR